MTERKCLYIQGTAGAPTYSATDMRTMVAALMGGRGFAAVAPGTGAIGKGHGVLAADALQVSSNGDNTVDVSPGIGAVRGTQVTPQGAYLCPLDATEVLTIDAKDTTNTRVDYVVAQVKDGEYNTLTGDVWELTVVKGTPGLGAPALPEDCLALAQVTVLPGTGSTVIASGDILDLRPHARPPGGVTPVASLAAYPDPRDYEVVWDVSQEKMLLYKGGSWVTIGEDFSRSWETYTPTFLGVTIGNGTRYGRFMRLGRTVVGVAGFDLGSTGNVTGGIIMFLPVNAHNPGSGHVYVGAGRAFIGTSFYACTAEIAPAFSPEIMFNFSTAGDGGWGATVPANWGTPGAGNGQLRVFFDYEAAA